MKNSIRFFFGPAQAVMVMFAVCTGPTQADVIQPGFDLLQTLPGGGSLEFDTGPLGGPGIVTIPMQGFPIGPGQTDTIIRRTGGLPSGVGGTGSIPAEIVALSLVSVDPVSLGPDSFDVFVTLRAGEASLGTVVVTSHDDAATDPGGNFDSNFVVKASVTLRNTVTSATMGPFSVDEPLISSGASWFHDPPPDYPETPSLPAGNFYIGPAIHEGPHPVTFPAVTEGVPSPTDHLPPLCDPRDFGDGYQIVNDKHAEWAVDPNQMVIDLTEPSRHCPVPLTAVIEIVGEDELETFDSILEGNFGINNPSNGERIELPLVFQGPVQTIVRGKAGKTAGSFQTEILSMDLKSVTPITLPDGNQITPIIREDPNRASLGRTVISNIGSSGQDGVRVDLPRGASPIAVLDEAITGTIPYCSNDPTDLPGGGQLQDHCHQILFIEREDLGNGEYLEFNESILSGNFSDGKQVVPFQLQGQTVISAKNEAGTGSFQTEIVSMSLSGDVGGIPLEIRQSQQNPSQGGANVRQNNDGSFQVDSFFDVFTEISVDGGQTFAPVENPTHMQLGATNFVVDSFFDVFTEISFDGGETWTPQSEAARMQLGRPPLPGDTDGDRDIDIPDILNSIAGFTGPTNNPENLNQKTISDSRRINGDSDGDRDTDIPDILTQIANFTGPKDVEVFKASAAGGGSPTLADLIYDPATGNLKIDPSEAAGGKITGFVLKNAVGGSDFDTVASTFPAGGISTDLALEISWADPFGGFSSTHDLGNILPTGLTVAGVESFLTTRDFTGALGTGGPFKLDVVPEPSSIALMWMSGALFGAVVWRRRRKTA